MKKEKKKRIKSSRKLIILSTIGVFVVGFLTWFLIRFFTLETKLETINLFEAPSSVSLENLANIKLGSFAVSLDGEVITGGELMNEARPTASTAKMILGLAIMQAKPFELGEPGEMLTITPEFYQKYVWYINHGGSNVAVRSGEEIS